MDLFVIQLKQELRCYKQIFQKHWIMCIFFRGTGKDATDKVIVNGLKMLRQNYWVKGTYVVELLNKMKYLGEHQKG